jgi:predicted GTPase
MSTRTVLIMGAAGKDFHVFNTCYRGKSQFHVAAFTAAQIPHIEDRRYPASLAGPLYPDGIPIRPENELCELIRSKRVDEVVFAYSDVSYAYLEERAALVRSMGAVFKTFDVEATMLASRKPVIAVCAVRTGCGKSQTSRAVISALASRGLKTVAVRHPMPYGDLERQALQRFATIADLAAHDCTIEEMEEYEPHIRNGGVVYAGVDYAAILASAEREADVILWDGGNNDTPFFRPDLWITVADPHRPGHELSYFPGKTNFERADVIVINKCNTAKEADIQTVERNARAANSRALVLRADSPVTVSDPELVRGKRALVVEDGPTLTHGEMRYGAGVVAAQACGAAAIIDPRPWVTGEIAETFRSYPGIGNVLPAMGYGARQMRDLALTIAHSDCDVVLIGTPIDLARVIRIEKPHVRVTYELDSGTAEKLADRVEGVLGKTVEST